MSNNKPLNDALLEFVRENLAALKKAPITLRDGREVRLTPAFLSKWLKAAFDFELSESEIERILAGQVPMPADFFILFMALPAGDDLQISFDMLVMAVNQVFLKRKTLQEAVSHEFLAELLDSNP